MTSFGLFRRAVREPSYRTVAGAAATGPPVTPIGTFRKAICTYHQSGRQAALNGISLPSDYWRLDARGKTLAHNYRTSLETYFRLDIADGRQTYDAGVKQAVNIAGEILNVYMDALVYRQSDHGARVALWDVPQPSPLEAATMASPIIDALEIAVGEDRAHSAALWHLRSGTIIEVDRATAKTHSAAAGDAVRRAAGV